MHAYTHHQLMSDSLTFKDVTKFLVNNNAVDLLLEVANRSEAPRLTVSRMS